MWSYLKFNGFINIHIIIRMINFDTIVKLNMNEKNVITTLIFTTFLIRHTIEIIWRSIIYSRAFHAEKNDNETTRSTHIICTCTRFDPYTGQRSNSQWKSFFFKYASVVARSAWKCYQTFYATRQQEDNRLQVIRLCNARKEAR